MSLKKHGYEVDLVESGEAAVSLGTSRVYDVAIVDLGLPGIDGIEVVHALRDSTSVPIIVLSASHDEARKIRALIVGADDYVTKPFSVGELVARMRGDAAHEPAECPLPVVETAAFRIDFAAERATTTAGVETPVLRHRTAPRRDPRSMSRPARHPT